MKGLQRRSNIEGFGAEVVPNRCIRVLVWNPMLELDGALLPMDSSIRDFQQGKAGYMANTLEQPLLLPQDMADLKSLNKHKVFLTLKKDLAMVRILNCHFPLFCLKISF